MHEMVDGRGDQTKVVNVQKDCNEYECVRGGQGGFREVSSNDVNKVGNVESQKEWGPPSVSPLYISM